MSTRPDYSAMGKRGAHVRWGDRPQVDRFWEKYCPEPNTGCWLWTAGATSHRYGLAWLEGRRVGAHRVAWLLTRGPIPPGLQVCHRCDTPPCINPAHLFLGDAAENSRDKWSKGRGVSPPGRGKSNAKLHDHQVRAMR